MAMDEANRNNRDFVIEFSLGYWIQGYWIQDYWIHQADEARKGLRLLSIVHARPFVKPESASVG